jgi:NIPSNAP
MGRITRLTLIMIAALGAVPPVSSQSTSASPGVVEIRSYNLKPGTRDQFHERFVREAMPMLRRWRVNVVAYGPSLHDRDSYYLIRAFSSLDDRQRQEDAFYGSAEWREGLREAVLADIDTYTTVVVRADAEALRSLSGTLVAKPF